MKRGYLSEYFAGVAARRLTSVETDRTVSNQHEYAAPRAVLDFLGRPESKQRFDTRFMYLNDEEPDPVIEDAFLTLGNRRDGKPRAPEFRLYFPDTAVSEKSVAGDLMVLAKKQDGSLLVIVARESSGIARQIEWLFGFGDLEGSVFLAKQELESEHDRIEFASRFILENIGIAVEAPETGYLEEMLSRFKGKFPTTREFSSFARSTLRELSAKDNPDIVLMTWIEREEVLFRAMERHLIADRIHKGFPGDKPGDIDVDGFISFSLSVQNRRKSRVGLALENHLELLFQENGLRYKRTAVTENKSKPDFIFPGDREYHTPEFDPLRLTMLGVKSTCKDRWRQVLAEADRVADKHLLTLETAISKHQTDEMANKRLQLVLPRGLHRTYTEQQQEWLMDLTSFTNLVKLRQEVELTNS